LATAGSRPRDGAERGWISAWGSVWTMPHVGVRPSAGTRREHLARRRDVSRETSPHRVGDTPDEAARAARHGHDPRCVGPRQAASAFELNLAAVQQGDEVARPNRYEGLSWPRGSLEVFAEVWGCPAHVDEDSDRSGPAKRSEAPRPVPDTGRPPPRGLARATLCPRSRLADVALISETDVEEAGTSARDDWGHDRERSWRSAGLHRPCEQQWLGAR
jgi:hypothetical protein